MAQWLRSVTLITAVAVLLAACAAPVSQAPTDVASSTAPQRQADVRPEELATSTEKATTAPEPSTAQNEVPTSQAKVREPRKITVTFATLAAPYLDQIVAMEKGYYREQGLELEIVRAGGGVATPALISGEVQFSTSASSALSAMLKGAELTIVYTNLSKPSYKLYSSKPEIKTLHDMVGKQVGISSRGDTGELSVRLLLKKHGIDPDSVIYTPLGDNSLRLAAVQTGSIDAAPLTPADIVQLGQPNGHMLADAQKEVEMVWNGVAVSNRLLKEEPDLVERFLRAVIKGREYARRYRDQTIEFIAKHDDSPRNAVETDYDNTILSMTQEGWVSDDVVKAEVETRAGVVGVSTPPSPDKLFDYSLVKKVNTELKAARWQPER